MSKSNPSNANRNSQSNHLSVNLVLPQLNAYVDDGLFVLNNDYYKKIHYESILWLEASGNYCYIHLTDKKMLVVHTLSELERKLPPEKFIRTHRSSMVNLFAIDGFVGNTLCIGKYRIKVSNTYRNRVFSLFNILKRKKYSTDEEYNKANDKSK